MIRERKDLVAQKNESVEMYANARYSKAKMLKESNTFATNYWLYGFEKEARKLKLGNRSNNTVFFPLTISVMTDNAFKARDIGLRAQKKILSRMATKNVAKVFIDGTTASLLDNVYRLAKTHVRKSQNLFQNPSQ